MNATSSSSSSIAEQLALWVHKVRLEDLPPATVEQARRCCLDWLGSAYAGSTHPTATRYLELARNLGGTGPYSVVGHPEVHLDLSTVVLVNGAFGHIAETDDGHRASILHPGAVVFPVLFALAPHTANPGRTFIEGAVVGYELLMRAGEALGKDHYATWHTTATAGIFGSTAAAAKALGLSAQQITHALGHAGTQCAGLWQFLEDDCLDAKPFHPGMACRAGVMAAMLAKSGIAGARHIFEGPKGVLAALGRDPNPAQLTNNLGSVWKIDEANFKAYPTCGQTHSMIDALIAIMGQHKPDPARIRSIRAKVYQRAIQVAGNAHPTTLEEAKFSIPFCLAHMALKGSLPFAGLGLEHVQDPKTRALMDKVSIEFDEEMDKGFPAARPCKVIVVMDDGTTFEAENKFRRGDPENPADFDELARKFHDLTLEALNAEQSRKLVHSIAQLPEYDGFAQNKS